ncbi:HPF/RaiA family ribosome-associated protein [Povalibacter sp.]|uniref:HPF/RaiA family ribosome-associated protein n=1 Tax=Povalibacter sp. TaxID=1962978 RepID=UPI002F3F1543
MQIHVNHDNHLRIAQDTSDRLAQTVEDSLTQYKHQITRVDMHLADLNGAKHGDSDKRCKLEARLDHLQPVAVSHEASSIQLAIDGALKKLDNALSHAIGKRRTF